MKFDITLTEAELQIVLDSLAQQPFIAVHSVIASIQQQAAAIQAGGVRKQSDPEKLGTKGRS